MRNGEWYGKKQPERDPIKDEAMARHERHTDHPTHRPLSKGYELVGLRGEEALARYFGAQVDLSPRPGGDRGIDIPMTMRDRNGNIKTFTIDVKAARKAFHLIVEQGKVKNRTIYVLASYSDKTDTATLLGWEWGRTILAAPLKDFGYGVINHYIPRERLRDLSELSERQKPNRRNQQ